LSVREKNVEVKEKSPYNQSKIFCVLPTFQ